MTWRWPSTAETCSHRLSIKYDPTTLVFRRTHPPSVTLCVPQRHLQLYSAAVDLTLTAASTVTSCVSAAVDLILTTGKTVSVYDRVISICTVYNTQKSLAAGDLILTAASTVTLCVSHSHSGYLTSAFMRCTVCLHNSNVTGRDTQFYTKYLWYCSEKK